MSDFNWITNITAYDTEKDEPFKLILNAKEVISIAEDTFEVFAEETGDFVKYEGCEVYVHDCRYKVLNSYEDFIDFIRESYKGD